MYNTLLNNKKIGKETYRLVIVMLLIFMGMTLLRPQLFLRSSNFLSMGYQLPELGLYSLAMMLVMLSGGIDLSIVSIGNFSGVIAATLLSQAVRENYPAGQMTGQVILTFSLSIAIGIALGALNGSLIVLLKISPMLLTMATASIITGMSIVITKGKSISGIPESLLYFGNHTLLGVPYALWMLVIALVSISFLLNRNKFGFKLKMIGSNSIAGQYSGINVKSVIIKTYMLSGLLSALCGLEILLKTNTAKADYASTYVIQAILCAVLGATNPNGGFAKVSCLVFSLLSLQFLSSGFNMLRLGGYYKDFSWGLLLMVVLSLEYFSAIVKKSFKKRMRKQ